MIFVVCFLSLVAHAMNITFNGLDEITGKRVVKTSWESIKDDDTFIRFRMADDDLYMELKFSPNRPITVTENTPLYFKAIDGSIITLNPLSTYNGWSREGWSSNPVTNNPEGVVALYCGDFSWFKDKVAKLMRVHTLTGYYDLYINENKGRNIRKLYELFYQAVHNLDQKSAFSNFYIHYMVRKRNRATWSERKVVHEKKITQDELQNLINEWKSKSDNQYEYDCVIKRHD